MNEKKWLYVLLMLLGVFTSSISQVLLKKESLKKHSSVVSEYLNFGVVTAYTVFLACTLVSILAYRVIPLSMGAILESTSYIYITVFGVTIFHERMTYRKAIALTLIISGVITYSAFG